MPDAAIRTTSTPSFLRGGLVAAALAFSTMASFAGAEGLPSTTPYRPSVSTPAALSAPGWLEAEFGWQRSLGDSPLRRDALPYSLKLAFTDDWGMRIGGEAWVRAVDGDGASLRGGGDTSFILKRRFAVDDAAAFGLEAGVNLPTARRGLGGSKADYTLNGIYSADFASWHTDLNLAATRLGSVDADQRRLQTGWAAALSRQINEQWSSVGELSGTHQGGTPHTAQFLLAASYNVTRAVTLDAGCARGLNHATYRWSFFAGATVLLGKVF